MLFYLSILLCHWKDQKCLEELLDLSLELVFYPSQIIKLCVNLDKLRYTLSRLFNELFPRACYTWETTTAGWEYTGNGAALPPVAHNRKEEAQAPYPMWWCWYHCCSTQGSPDATEPLNTSEQPFAWSPWRRQWHPLKCSRPENPMDGAAGSSSDCKEKRRQSKGSKDRKSSRWKALRQSTPAQSGTGKPGVLQSMGSQSVGHDWATELNWCSVCPPW